MPIVKQEDWKEYEDKNKDPYGNACIMVAREVMRLLDTPKYEKLDTHKIICDADDNIGAGGITGFMATCVTVMVSHCHSRGGEFRKAWNLDNQIGNEGEKANTKEGAVINPALLNIG